MIASVHLAVGASSGFFMQRLFPSKSNLWGLFVSFLSGVASHIILDAIPHVDYYRIWPWPLVILETAVVFFLLFSVSRSRISNLIIFFGMAGAAFPDLSSRFSGFSIVVKLDHVLHFYHANHGIALKTPIFIQLAIAAVAIALVRPKAA